MEINKMILEYYSASAQALNRNISTRSVHSEGKEHGGLLNPKDTVSFSAAAREAVFNMAIAGETEEGNDAANKQLNGQTEASVGGDVFYGSGHTADIRARISQLTSRLAQIMSSGLPENAKTAQASALYAQISELSAQLTGLSRIKA